MVRRVRFRSRSWSKCPGSASRRPGLSASVDSALLAHAAALEECADCGARDQEVEKTGPGAADRAAPSRKRSPDRHRSVARMRAPGERQVQFLERNALLSGRGGLEQARRSEALALQPALLRLDQRAASSR